MMGKYKRQLLAAVLAVLLVIVIVKLASTSNSVVPASTNNTDFALKLFSEFTKKIPENSNANIVISPFSTYTALSMALNGAAGTTRAKMAAAMGTAPNSVDSLNKRNQALFTALSSQNDKITLEIANAVYTNSSTPFKHEFTDLCNRLYGAEIQSIDFQRSDTVDKINSWCNLKTHGKIPAIVEQLLPNEKMLLLNAVYFKGKWKSPFIARQTKDDKFMLLSGNNVPIKMMQTWRDFLYFKSPDFQALSIPYAGGRQSLYVLLPNKRVQLPAFCAQFTKDNWKEWIASLHSTDVHLSMPRFTTQYSTDLSSNLRAMGMAEAFTEDAADFSNMIGFPYKAWISRVLQKTYLEINEEGTKAAAATAVVIAPKSAPGKKVLPPVEFRVDHPFVLALADNDTGEILFLGLILNPTK